MTHHPESNASEFAKLTTRVERHVARHLERGDDVFYARPLMASLAIALMTGERYHEAVNATTNAALSVLKSAEAEGEVYAIRQDLGNGLEDGRDRVHVTSRSGVLTNAPYGTENGLGRTPVVRARTTR